MSSSSHEGFITSLSPIACNNRRSRKYGCLVVIARQLSRSDNVRLYADPRVYGPSCILQFLRLVFTSLRYSARKWRECLRENFFATKLLPPVIEDIVCYSFGEDILFSLKFRALWRKILFDHLLHHTCISCEVFTRCREQCKCNLLKNAAKNKYQ